MSDLAKASAAVQTLIDAAVEAGRAGAASNALPEEISRTGEFIARGKFLETLRECRRILKRDPDNALARLYSGIAMFKTGDLLATGKHLRRYLALQGEAHALRDEVAAVLGPLSAHHQQRQLAGLEYETPSRQEDETVPRSRRMKRVSYLGRPPGAVLNLNWIITRHCNFTCSYCTVYNNALDYPKLDQLKSATDKIARLNRPEVKAVLSGGEPTLHPGYLPFIKYLAERLPNLTTLRTETNLSRTPRFYRELVESMREHLSVLAFHASYHFEFTKIDQFLTNARFLSEQGIDVQIRLLAHPERMPAVKRLAEELNAQRNEHLTLILKTVRKSFGMFPDDRYTAEDLAWLAEGHGHEDLERPIAVDFENALDGGAEIERKLFNANELIAQRLNRFKGMGCYTGLEMLSIAVNGALNRAVCYSGKPGPRPNIYRDAEIPAAFLKPVICPFDACGCPEDIAISKTAVNRGSR